MKRRDFLKITGTATTGLALGSLSGNKLLTSLQPDDEARKIKKFGIQLYTLRSDLPKDPKGVLKQLADYGYKQIESFEGSRGMFWGMTNTEFKKYMDDLGMKVVSSHCDISKDFEKKADEAAAIGMDYLICPWKGPQKSLDNFKKFADEFNQKGEICKKAGIHFAYHNHDYSFRLMDGQYPQDVMMKNTDTGLVDYEMDIYWVVTGGQDPVEWMKKYPNRFTLSHVKDRKKDAKPTDADASVIVGQGSIDYVKILKKARKLGMKYYIIEQERYDDTTPLKAAEADAVYMKKLRI